MEGRDIDLFFREDAGDLRNIAGLVLVADDQRRLLGGKAQAHVADTADLDASAAHGGRFDVRLRTVHALEDETRGVRMGHGDVAEGEGKEQAALAGILKALGHTHVVRRHAEQPRDDGFVGAVAAARGGEGAGERDVRLRDLLAEDAAAGEPDAHRAVCELEGPTMIGPIRSKISIKILLYREAFSKKPLYPHRRDLTIRRRRKASIAEEGFIPASAAAARV